MTFRLWPQSLFGRLMAAFIVALLLAQVVSLVMIARERERFILQGGVREWSRRVAEVTTLLQGMDDTDRAAMINRLTERPWRFGHRPPDAVMFRDGLVAPPEGDPSGAPPPGVEEPMPPGHPEPRHGDDARAIRGAHRPPMPTGPPHEDTRSLILRATTYPAVVPFTKAGDFEPAFEEQLHKDLGPEFAVEVSHTADPTKRAIPIGGPLFSEVRDSGAELYDAKIKFPDGYTAVFRVTRYARGAPLPRGLFMNLALLLIVMSVALFVVARSITRPLSDLARAADSIGRNLRQPQIVERGAREIRNAARAFNTMQDRMQRYLDSRSRVLAAMSHDLKTPLTRLRLQVEM